MLAKTQKLLLLLLSLVFLIMIGLIVYTGLLGTKTVRELLLENKELRGAIANLTQEYQIGYAKVVAQYREPDGREFTRLLFIETDPADPLKRILEKEFTIEGRVVHFDALIVQFDKQLVLDGKARALYIWRRVYGEKMKPEDGFPIEPEDEQPRRYQRAFAKLPLNRRRQFWSAIWELANDPEQLAEIGVRAISGHAVYKELRPGLIYIFKIDATGGIIQETIPAI